MIWLWMSVLSVLVPDFYHKESNSQGRNCYVANENHWIFLSTLNLEPTCQELTQFLFHFVFFVLFVEYSYGINFLYLFRFSIHGGFLSWRLPYFFFLFCPSRHLNLRSPTIRCPKKLSYNWGWDYPIFVYAWVFFFF